ncbi:MAG: sigma-70 family RNA polymerase sigma factor [Pseudomonadota bacterium]
MTSLPASVSPAARRHLAFGHGEGPNDLLWSAPPRLPLPRTPRILVRPPSPDAATADRAERDRCLAAWVAEAAAGSAAAFERFYDATVGHAQALARRMLAPADLEDVLAEAYFQAWREAARFDPLRGSAVTWLLTIVRSRALDLLRRRRAEGPADGPEALAEHAADAPGPPDLLHAMERGCALHAALAALSAQERWLLGLAYFRELSHAQISQATGMPLGSVKSALHRAQGKLRETLAAHGKEALSR